MKYLLIMLCVFSCQGEDGPKGKPGPETHVQQIDTAFSDAGYIKRGCYTKSVDGGVELICGDKTQMIRHGQGCKISKDGNKTTITCGDQTVSLFDGQNGKDGQDGLNGSNGSDGKDGQDGRRMVRGTLCSLEWPALCGGCKYNVNYNVFDFSDNTREAVLNVFFDQHGAGRFFTGSTFWLNSERFYETSPVVADVFHAELLDSNRAKITYNQRRFRQVECRFQEFK